MGCNNCKSLSGFYNHDVIRKKSVILLQMDLFSSGKRSVFIRKSDRLHALGFDSSNHNGCDLAAPIYLQNKKSLLFFL